MAQIQGTSGSSQEGTGISPAQRLFTKCSKNSLLPIPKSQCQLGLEGGLCQGWRITGPS